LSDAIRKFFYQLDVPNGLTAVGFNMGDIDRLVQGTLPQHRVTKLAPSKVGVEELSRLFENTMTIY
jgi:hydroxyacid-oxoacid transhydrogenase